MNTSNLTSAGRFNSDDIYVNVYRRVCPSSTPNQSERQKISDLHFSTKKPMEVKLKIFLDMGKDCIDDLELIANTEDKTQRSFLKRERLSAGSISGTFHTRDRKVPLSKKLKHYNGIIALDFDNVDDVEAGKKTITQLPYVYYVGLSASRRGFFAIVPLDNTDYTRHSLYFSALQMEMDKIGFTIDKACSDVTRLRFVSYDPSPYYNEDCELYILPEGFGEESTDPIREKKDDAGDNPKLARVKAYAQEWEMKKIPLDDYDDWRTIAMSLSSLGEDGWDILDTVSRFSKSYDAGDNRKKFDEFLKNTRSIGIGSFFFKCQEYGVIPPSIPHYEMIPFPVDVFPEPIRKIISETHKCLNFSVDHIASSLLFAASIAVGNSIIVEIKNEWIDKAILYVAIVGKPGTNKSAPLRYALRPLAERDKKEMDRYEKLKAAYDEQMRAPSKERKKTLVEPEYVQIVLSDFTTEVLVRQHKINPRGLAVYVDELIGFIKCFNKYRSGNDEQIWTQLYNGGSVIVNRVSSQPLNIEDTCIGVIGTIQPGLLYEFAKGKTESGFVDRWLFAYPDDSAYPKMNQEQLPKEITRNWGEVIDRIFKLPHETGTKHFRLTKDAMAVYAQWYNALADQKNASSSVFAEMATKMERYCIRFAIVLEALKYACGDKPIKSISVSSVKGGIDLCYYYMGCAQKARKKFNINPLDELNDRQREIYNELPITFTTAEGLEIARDYAVSERTFKEWLKSNFFRHISHGQYEKRYK